MDANGSDIGGKPRGFGTQKNVWVVTTHFGHFRCHWYNIPNFLKFSFSVTATSPPPIARTQLPISSLPGKTVEGDFVENV